MAPNYRYGYPAYLTWEAAEKAAWDNGVDFNFNSWVSEKEEHFERINRYSIEQERRAAAEKWTGAGPSTGHICPSTRLTIILDSFNSLEAGVGASAETKAAGCSTGIKLEGEWKVGDSWE